MTAAVFEESDKRRTRDRGFVDELVDQPTSLLALGTLAVLIIVVGQLTQTLSLAFVVAVLFTAGMVRLLSQRRASLLQTVAIGMMHLGVAMLVAGTV